MVLERRTRRLITTVATLATLAGAGVGVKVATSGESEKAQGRPPATAEPQKPPEVTTPAIKDLFTANADGGYTYRAETGEVLNVPSIPGLRAVKEDIDGNKVMDVVYRALEGNPYGIETNKFAGIYYADAFVVENSQEKMVGSVVLSAPVVGSLTQQALGPNPRDPVAIIAAPFDPTTATASNQTVVFENDTYRSVPFLFMHVPIGTAVVNPLETNLNDHTTNFDYTQTIFPSLLSAIHLPSVNPRPPSYPYLTLQIGDGGTQATKIPEGQIPLGKSISTISVDNAYPSGFTQQDLGYTPTLESSRGVNLRILKGIARVPFTYDNILKVENIPIAILSNDNPLLAK